MYIWHGFVRSTVNQIRYAFGTVWWQQGLVGRRWYFLSIPSPRDHPSKVASSSTKTVIVLNTVYEYIQQARYNSSTHLNNMSWQSCRIVMMTMSMRSLINDHYHTIPSCRASDLWLIASVTAYRFCLLVDWYVNPVGRCIVQCRMLEIFVAKRHTTSLPAREEPKCHENLFNGSNSIRCRAARTATAWHQRTLFTLSLVLRRRVAVRWLVVGSSRLTCSLPSYSYKLPFARLPPAAAAARQDLGLTWFGGGYTGHPDIDYQSPSFVGPIWEIRPLCSQLLYSAKGGFKTVQLWSDCCGLI